MNTPHIMPTYFNKLPIHFVRGEGVWLFDENNTAYLDGLAGIAVTGLGHAHPKITAAICDQAARLLHCSNTYEILEQEALGAKLCELSGMEQAYFCNSGAEANEAAIKLTRLFARKKNIAHPEIICMHHSFHGRTFAALCATGAKRIQEGFEPLMPGFIHLDLNDFEALAATVAERPNVVAIMFETIQGDGGIYAATPEYLQKVRALCDSEDLLMILDEVQCGLGRTGKWFAYQFAGVQPDILMLAKGLANGIPIGACLSRGKANNLFGPGKHGSTFGGTPFVCRVALTVLETMLADRIVENAYEAGQYLLSQLQSQLRHDPMVKAIRGYGMMIGIELDRTAFALPALGLKHRVLFNIVANTVVRLLPPLIMTQAEADELISRLKETLEEFHECAKQSA